MNASSLLPIVAMLPAFASVDRFGSNVRRRTFEDMSNSSGHRSNATALPWLPARASTQLHIAPPDTAGLIVVDVGSCSGSTREMSAVKWAAQRDAKIR